MQEANSKCSGREFRQVGGARFGQNYLFALNFTFPFAVLVVTPNDLTIKVSLLIWRKAYYFERQTVTIAKYQGLFSKGLRVRHTNHRYPPLLVFWTRNLMAAEGALKDLGFQFSD